MVREQLGVTRSLRTEDTHPLPTTHCPMPTTRRLISASASPGGYATTPERNPERLTHKFEVSQERTVELTHGSQQVWSRVRWTSAAGVQAVNRDITGFGVGSAGVCVLSAFVYSYRGRWMEWDRGYAGCSASEWYGRRGIT